MVNPSDDKYRRLRLSNPKITAAIVDVPGALDALLAMGWQHDPSDTDFLVCPRGVKITMAEVIVSTSRAEPALVVGCAGRPIRTAVVDRWQQFHNSTGG